MYQGVNLEVPLPFLGSVCSPPDQPREKRRIYSGQCPQCGKAFGRVIGARVTCSDECEKALFFKVDERRKRWAAGNKARRMTRAQRKAERKKEKAKRRQEKKRLAEERKVKSKEAPRVTKTYMEQRFGVGFYTSREWLALRYEALKRSGRTCAVCGMGKEDGVKLHVDHIKPRSLYPQLELSLENLQVLCEGCNLGKGNRDEIDWR